MSEQIPAGFVPIEDIADSGILPDGAYQVRGVSLEPTTSSTGKKMFRMVAVVELPEAQQNLNLYESYVIGTESDPGATLKETWVGSVGARRWKQLLKAASVPMSNQEAQLCAGFEGSVFCAVATTYTEKDGDYAGTMRNRYNFYKVGTYPPGVVQKGRPGPGRVAAAAAPVPVVPMPQAVSRPQPVAPIPQPVVQAAPTQVPAGILLPCGICGQQFSPQDFPAHVAQCLMSGAKQPGQ